MTDEASKAVPKHNRRRRAAVGGFRTKLDAPSRAGFVRRWVNDDPGRIQEMHELGYDFAEADTRTSGQGTRISRQVGKDANGKPTHAFLMETPTKEYEVGVKEKEERLSLFEEAIREGRDTTGKLENAYEPGSRSSISHSNTA
jgi:hypothetical protein